MRTLVKKTRKKQSPEQQSVEDWLDSLDPAQMQVSDAVHLRAVGVVLGTSRQAAHRRFAK